MHLWLDTINCDVVAHAAKMGIIDGVTTNPSILSMTKNVPKTLSTLLEVQKGPVAVQVTAQEAPQMVVEARAIFSFSKRTVIKIPVNTEGLTAIQELRKENIPVFATGIFHPTQALLAAHQGATYICPYFSHIKEIADAHETLKTMHCILQHTDTKILGASLQTLEDIVFCATLGIDAVTVKEDLFHKLIETPSLLEKCAQKFASNWKSSHGNASLKDLLSPI